MSVLPQHFQHDSVALTPHPQPQQRSDAMQH
jgi:hypothetical protein